MSTDLRIDTSLSTVKPPVKHRCELCNHTKPNDVSQTYQCTRCGLISYGANADVVLTPKVAESDAHIPDSAGNIMPVSIGRTVKTPYNHSAHVQDALCAYQFSLYSKLNDLLPRDVISVVIDYLIWYRSHTDFCVGDRVDAMDQRNNWCDATVIVVEQARRRLKVHFDKDQQCHKYDIWLKYDSNNLAPHGSKMKHKLRQENPTTNEQQRDKPNQLPNITAAAVVAAGGN